MIDWNKPLRFKERLGGSDWAFTTSNSKACPANTLRWTTVDKFGNSPPLWYNTVLTGERDGI